MENQKEIAKAYSPAEVEDKWYQYWENGGIFRSSPDERPAFTIVIPPPNITGMLTMGHVLNNTIQDIFIRWKRKSGFNACWVPGTDHASIATETKVTVALKEQGIDKFDIGREEFLKHCQIWRKKYGGIIIKQLRKLGVSCDWERERFTMDDDYYNAVIKAFVALYNDGKIYRGYRMVNWCPASKSAISDEEVTPRETAGKLYYFKYPVAGTGEFITVATTRPETMLGDTGVAVNPSDERYASFIGKQIELPLTGRLIPIFADEYVDVSFGTGVVKVTPAHDKNDYEMGIRHGLEIINIFNEDASLNHNVPEEFRGLDRFDARKKVVSRLQEAGLVEKIEEYKHNVGYSERGGVPIEPYLSEQWFMKMDELAEPAIDAVRSGKINFHPAHWVKTYEHWMTNLNDWCISRQLWWGHRIPVWYCNEIQADGKHCPPVCSTETPEKCPTCGSSNIHQDEDVLDTWASSWLWAHDVFTTENDLKYYYPTDLLVTAPDIIFFWVARMIMAGYKFVGDLPFRDVYFTSVIRDEQGKKMSKSLGNSPDPLEVIAEYGADALRFTIIYLAPLGQDVRFGTKMCELGRNFANKLWNAGRFLLMNKKEWDSSALLPDDTVDKWINSRLNSTLKDLDAALQKFEVNAATKIIYSFVWNDFCDWYIELIKNKLYSEDSAVALSAYAKAITIFEQILGILHPFMPYITEELWHLTAERKDGESISTTAYPLPEHSAIDPVVEQQVELLQDIITAVRNIRGEMNIPPSRPIDVIVKTDALPADYAPYIKKLGKAGEVTLSASAPKPAKAASAVVKEYEIFIPLEGVIDLDAERLRLNKEIERLKGALAGVDKKLSNESFVKNAPPQVLENEQNKKKDWIFKLEKLEEILNSLQ